MKKKIKPFKEIMKQIIKKILNVGGHLLEILNNFIVSKEEKERLKDLEF